MKVNAKTMIPFSIALFVLVSIINYVIYGAFLWQEVIPFVVTFSVGYWIYGYFRTRNKDAKK